MPSADTCPHAPRPARAWALAAVWVVAAVSVVGCGGEDEPPEAEPAAPAPGEATTAQPPPETAPEGSGGQASEQAENALAADAETGPQPCSDVEITPDSGNGLFDVEAEGVTCDDATVALEAWGSSGFPGDSPPGFSCEEVPEEAGRLSCEQEASGAILEFTLGN